MKKQMKTRLKILLTVGVTSLAITCAIISALFPSEASLPKIAFQSYTNSPNGETYAIVAVTNSDLCAYTFHQRFQAIIEKTNCWYVINSSLANQTLKPNSSTIGVVEVPPHAAKWVVIATVTRHTFLERYFSGMFSTNRFDEIVESNWMP